MKNTAEAKKSAFNKAANDRYLEKATKTFEELNSYLSYEKNNWADGCTGDEWETIEDAMIAGEEAATLILEEEREKLEASKAAAALGRKGGKAKTAAKKASGKVNAAKASKAAALSPAVRKARSERMKAMWAKKKAQQ